MADDVKATHPEYDANVSKWTRCRDCYDGGDAVKAKSTTYLPALKSHKQFADGTEDYEAYKKRALFYNATRRTVVGLVGLVLQKPPDIDVDDKFRNQLQDVTLTGVSAETLIGRMMREVILVGRYGVLVDMAEKGTRPYWTTYRAEDITNWRVEKVDGTPKLTMVTLRERVLVPSKDNKYKLESVDTYRLLQLDGKTYTQTVYKPKKPGSKEYVADKTVTPIRRGTKMPFLPFTFVGASDTVPDVDQPPILDLVDVNLSHYQNSADLENGLHCLGLPQMVLIGAESASDDDVPLGSSNVIFIPQGGSATLLQADGSRFGALNEALERKEKMMATLGARMLEDQARVAETASAVAMRHSGEHATLRGVAAVVEQACTQVLKYHAWWAGFEADVEKVDAKVELNKDFTNQRMSGQDQQALLALLQSEAISYQTFWFLLARGELARPDVTWEEELEAIKEGREVLEPVPVPPPPNVNAEE